MASKFVVMPSNPPKIVVVGDPVLATPAREVTEFDDASRR